MKWESEGVPSSTEILKAAREQVTFYDIIFPWKGPAYNFELFLKMFLLFLEAVVSCV